MPISTNSDAWRDGEEVPTTEHLVLDFLKSNPDEAYNTRELAEEIFEIDWTGFEEQVRKENALPEGEYLDRDEREDFPFESYYLETAIFEVKIRSLIEKGLVELKRVDAEEFGPEIPDDWETVIALSYK
jgi:hypothetical protein